MNFNDITKPLLMGILNVTPDSFSDGGKFNRVDHALKQAERLFAEGADIIDIGGESTRPGSDPVDAEEQIRRVVPIITAIWRQFSDVAISIDTTLSAVANAALTEGATLINDVSAGQSDPAILELAAQKAAPIILMHSQGAPKTMQDNPYYEDVLAEVTAFLTSRIDAALQAGIPFSNIAIDPGIGFGKRKQDNLDLLANLDQLVKLGCPVLLGTSRKRFMGAICNVAEPSELVTATAVTTALGVIAGVKLFRVHDIKENRQALEVAWAIRQQLESGQHR